MKATYGPYNHDDQPVLLTAMSDRARKENNIVVAMERSISIRWELYGATQAAIKTKIEAAEAGYGVQGRDFKLFHDDGTLSGHYLIGTPGDPDNNLVGVPNVEEFGWTTGLGIEYATRRTAFATVSGSATFSPGGGGSEDLLDYVDSFNIISDGTARVVYKELPSGSPVRHTLATTSLVSAIQSGSARAKSDFIFPTPLHPSSLLGAESSQTKIGPRTVNGVVVYETRWNYRFAGATFGTYEPIDPTVGPA